MEEKYVGRKFRTEFRSDTPPEDSRIYEIIDLGMRFSKMGLLPAEKGGHAGNFSFRNNRGFVITAGGVDKGSLKPNDFVQVLRCNTDIKKVTAEGSKQPSSETFAHHLIYSERLDVNAIVHVHDSAVLEKMDKLKIKKTEKRHPYGTIELAEDILKSLGKAKYIAVRGHGVIAVGKSLWEAGKLVETWHNAAVHI